MFILHNVIKIRPIIDKFIQITYLFAVIFRIVLNDCLYFKINVKINGGSSTDMEKHPCLELLNSILKTALKSVAWILMQFFLNR
jgi:hypothetical protein